MNQFIKNQIKFNQFTNPPPPPHKKKRRGRGRERKRRTACKVVFVCSFHSASLLCSVDRIAKHIKIAPQLASWYWVDCISGILTRYHVVKDGESSPGTCPIQWWWQWTSFHVYSLYVLELSWTGIRFSMTVSYSILGCYRPVNRTGSFQDESHIKNK